MRDTDFFLRHFAPVTTHLAFFEMPADDLAQVLYERASKINTDCEFDWTVKKNVVNGRLVDKLNALLPLTSVLATKTLLSATKSRWSVYIPNGFRGGDVHGEPRYLSGVLRVRTLTVVMTEDVPNENPGSMQFVYRDGAKAKFIETQYGSQHETPTRSIYAHKESKWEFGAHGEPLTFEELETYSAKKIKDRLTVSMIERYCGYLGVDLFNPDFYEGEGYIIHSYAPPNAKFFGSYPNAA